MTTEISLYDNTLSNNRTVNVSELKENSQLPNDFDIKLFLTNILWFLFMAQANVQIRYNNFHSNYASPLFTYLEKFLNLTDDDDDNSQDDNIVEEYCDFKFISCDMQYQDEQKSKSLSIELNDGDYVIGNKLFTLSWIKNYIENKQMTNEIILNDNYVINFIDHNINQIKIKSDEYIILDKNNYIIKTI